MEGESVNGEIIVFSLFCAALVAMNVRHPVTTIIGCGIGWAIGDVLWGLL